MLTDLHLVREPRRQRISIRSSGLFEKPVLTSSAPDLE